MNWNGLELPDKNIYFQDEDTVIYCADCREILPLIPDKSIDLVLTDPPYPNSDRYGSSDISCLLSLSCKQLIFWTPYCQFPLDYTAIHIWDKMNGGISQYEQIYERNGQKKYKCFRHYLINSKVAAQYCKDIFTGHPSQKPLQLITKMLAIFGGDLILDPFLGSGTTAYCAKKLGRKCIGIEIEEAYCRIAAQRCAQMVLPLESEQVQQGQGTSESLMFSGMASPTKSHKVRGKVSTSNIVKESDRE